MTSTAAAAVISTPDPSSKGPSIEESHAALVAEGLIVVDGETPGTEDAGKAKEAGSNEERPDWLPAKFKTVEAFLQSHEELERKLGQGGKKEGEDEGEEEAPKDDQSGKPTEEERKAAEEATRKAGVDLRAVSQEYLSKGELTADTYSKLEAAGYPREMVDVYAEGLMGRLNATQNAAHELVGGEAAYGELIDWAIENLSQEEQDAFDESVNSNNKARALMAIKGLKASRDAAVAKDASEEPEEQLAKGGKANANVYAHIDDYMADLDDPRYDSNETFRRQVMAKLGRSNIM